MTLLSLAAPASAQQAIVNGMYNAECVFPSAVYTGGCTATLVHPQAITTAQHCSPGAGTVVTFGEEALPTRNPVAVTQCVTGTSDDGAICALSSPVTGVPTTPIVFGCEVDKYLVADEIAYITGYGNIADMTPTDGKKWAQVHIAQVDADRTVVGLPVNGSSTTPSPCRGDSGGPVFLRTDDGSYRVFGTVFQGTTGTPCNGAANFQRVDTIVAAFESATSLDITPCFDGATGAWDPGPDCGGFYADEPGVSAGTWANMCSDAQVSGASTECGAADPGAGSGGAAGTGGDGAGAESGVGGDANAAGGSSLGGQSASSGGMGDLGDAGGADSGVLVGDGDRGDGYADGDSADDSSGDEGGCSCTSVGGKPEAPRHMLAWGSLLFLFALLRRRSVS